jgi:Ca2+-binding RTX toxin-like protein
VSYPTLPSIRGSQIPFFISAMEASSGSTPLEGWRMLDGKDLGLPAAGAGSLTDGIYTNQNASALLADAVFNGKRTLLVTFQESNDDKDFESDFRNINGHYDLYAPLVSKVAALVKTGLYDQVLVAGWSLGGAMTQMFISDYEGIAPIFGLTVGAPGYLQAGHTADSRVINYLDGRDLFVASGAERSLAKFLLPAQIDALSQLYGQVLQVPLDLFATSVPYMTANYYHTGKTVFLNGSLQSSNSLMIKLQQGDYTPLTSHLLSSYKTSLESVSQSPFALAKASIATAGNDHVFGSSGADILDGLAGADTLYGRTGMDSLTGGLGVDTASYIEKRKSVFIVLARDETSEASVAGAVEDTLRSIENLIGGSAGDTFTGDVLNNRLEGRGGSDILSGEGGNDRLFGGIGNDMLIGGAGADTLKGETGADTLNGGQGQDVLHGGGGVDRFVFDVQAGAANADRILDFKPGTDKLVLSLGIFTALAAESPGSPLQSSNFSATGTATDADDFIVFNTQTGELFYDADGNGATAALKFATVTTVGTTPLSAADSQFVA